MGFSISVSGSGSTKKKTSSTSSTSSSGFSSVGDIGNVNQLFPDNKLNVDNPFSGSGGSSPPEPTQSSSAPAPAPTPAPVQGPVPQGTSESTFRDTGTTTPVNQSFIDSRTPGTEVIEDKRKGIVNPNSLFTTEDRTPLTGGPLSISRTEAESLRDTSRSGMVVDDISFVDSVDAGQIAGNFQTFQTPVPLFGKSFKGDEAFTKTEAATAGEARGTINLFFDTKNAFNKDPESFIGKKGVVTTETDTGKTIELTSEFFDDKLSGIRKQAIEDANLKFESLSPETRRSVDRAGVVTGGKKFVGGFADLGVGIFGKLSNQELNAGSFKEILGFGESSRFGSGTQFGDVQSLPTIAPRSSTFLESPTTFVKESINPQTITSAGLVVGTLGLGGAGLVKSIKSEGLVGGVIESSQVFNPLSIKGGRFVAKPSGQSEFVSFKFEKDGNIFRNVISRDTGSGAYGFAEQRFAIVDGKEVAIGLQRNVGATPFIDIRGGGAFVKFGTGISSETGISTSASGLKGTPFRRTGKTTVGGDELPGSTADLVTRPEFDLVLFDRPGGGFDISGTFTRGGANTVRRVGGTSKKIGDSPVSDVVVGPRNPRFDITDEGVSLKGYRADIKAQGIEFDVSKLFSGGKSGTKTAGGGGGGRTSTRTQTDVVQDSGLSQITGATDIIKTSGGNIPKVTGFGSPKAVVGNPEQILKQNVQQISVSAPKLDTQVKTKTKQNEFFGSAGKLDTGLDFAFKDSNKFRTGLVSAPALKSGSKLKGLTAMDTFAPPAPIIVGDPLRPTGRIGTPFGFGGLPPFPGLLMSAGKTKRKKGKRKFRRTPSLVAATFGRTASLPSKLEMTGLVGRPIIKKKRNKNRFKR